MEQVYQHNANLSDKFKYQATAKLRSRYSQAREPIGASEFKNKYNTINPLYHLGLVLNENIYTDVPKRKYQNIPYRGTNSVL